MSFISGLAGARKRALGITLVLAAAVALLVARPAPAAVIGPVYPVPGAQGSGHGGNTCAAAVDPGAVDGAMGKGPGQTWSFGGGPATEPNPAPTTCPYIGLGPDLAPFDTSRFERLFWGISTPPQIALDGDFGELGEEAETLTIDNAQTNLAAGKVVWTGLTNMTWCNPVPVCSFVSTGVPTRFTLTITDTAGTPVPLLDPASVGISQAGVGGVVEVTPALNEFKANLLFEADNPNPSAPAGFSPALDMFNSLNHPNPPTSTSGFNTQMGVGGGFWFDSRNPVASFTHPAAQLNQPVTFTSTSSDPDGSIASESWDLNGDGTFGDATGPTAQETYGAGPHTVRLMVTDNDGETHTTEETFTVVDPTPPPDITRPIASLTVPKQKLGPVLGKGLKGKLKVNEAAGTPLKVFLSKALGRKLKLKGAIGGARVNHTASGNKSFKIKIKAGAKRKLAKLRSVAFVIQGKVTDMSGNASNVKKSVTVKK